MQDFTLRTRRGQKGLDRGENLTADQLLCCIPHCRHLQKAWAAYQIVAGLAVAPEERIDPDRDTQSLKAKGTVYVIRVGELIKIGWTSQPKRRMRDLQPDAILAYKAGTRHDELRLHAKCIDHLAKGREWFHANDEMLKFVSDFQSGAIAA